MENELPKITPESDQPIATPPTQNTEPQPSKKKGLIFAIIALAVLVLVGSYFFGLGDLFKGAFVREDQQWTKVKDAVEISKESELLDASSFTKNGTLNAGDVLVLEIISKDPVAFWVDEMTETDEIVGPKGITKKYTSPYGEIDHITSDKNTSATPEALPEVLPERLPDLNDINPRVDLPEEIPDLNVPADLDLTVGEDGEQRTNEEITEDADANIDDLDNVNLDNLDLDNLDPDNLDLELLDPGVLDSELLESDNSDANLIEPEVPEAELLDLEADTSFVESPNSSVVLSAFTPTPIPGRGTPFDPERNIPRTIIAQTGDKIIFQVSTTAPAGNGVFHIRTVDTVVNFSVVAGKVDPCSSEVITGIFESVYTRFAEADFSLSELPWSSDVKESSYTCGDLQEQHSNFVQYLKENNCGEGINLVQNINVKVVSAKSGKPISLKEVKIPDLNKYRFLDTLMPGNLPTPSHGEIDENKFSYTSDPGYGGMDLLALTTPEEDKSLLICLDVAEDSSAGEDGDGEGEGEGEGEDETPPSCTELRQIPTNFYNAITIATMSQGDYSVASSLGDSGPEMTLGDFLGERLEDYPEYRTDNFEIPKIDTVGELKTLMEQKELDTATLFPAGLADSQALDCATIAQITDYYESIKDERLNDCEGIASFDFKALNVSTGTTVNVASQSNMGFIMTLFSPWHGTYNETSREYTPEANFTGLDAIFGALEMNPRYDGGYSKIGILCLNIPAESAPGPDPDPNVVDPDDDNDEEDLDFTCKYDQEDDEVTIRGTGADDWDWEIVPYDDGDRVSDEIVRENERTFKFDPPSVNYDYKVYLNDELLDTIEVDDDDDCDQVVPEERIVGNVDPDRLLGCWVSVDPKDFSDIGENYYAADIIRQIASIGSEEGGAIAIGYKQQDNTTIYGPNKRITRAEAGKMAIYAACPGDLDTSNAGLKDNPNDAWYHDIVNALYNSGVATGYEDGTFRPDEFITRAEFASMLVKLYKLKDSSFDMSDYRSGVYADVESGKFWSTAAITLNDLGIMQGSVNSEGEAIFGPERNITRGETAVIINNFLAKLQGLRIRR